MGGIAIVCTISSGNIVREVKRMIIQEVKALSEWFRVRRGKTLKLNDKGIDCVIESLEKQIPKKIFHRGYEYQGKMIYPVGIDGVPYDLCPNCETNLCTDGFLGRNKKRMKYCENCGQKLDWSE